jgi:hypothetical protein
MKKVNLKKEPKVLAILFCLLASACGRSEEVISWPTPSLLADAGSIGQSTPPSPSAQGIFKEMDVIVENISPTTAVPSPTPDSQYDLVEEQALPPELVDAAREPIILLWNGLYDSYDRGEVITEAKLDAIIDFSSQVWIDQASWLRVVIDDLTENGGFLDWAYPITDPVYYDSWEIYTYEVIPGEQVLSISFIQHEQTMTLYDREGEIARRDDGRPAIWRFMGPFAYTYLLQEIEGQWKIIHEARSNLGT